MNEICYLLGRKKVSRSRMITCANYNSDLSQITLALTPESNRKRRKKIVKETTRAYNAIW